jgi:hypothetical protein
MGSLFLRFLPALVVIALLAGFGVWVANTANRANQLHAEVVLLRAEAEGLRASAITGNEISRIAADACKSVITLRVKHQREVEQIRDEVASGGSAWTAYDRILCKRPEAAQHPTCVSMASGGVQLPAVADAGVAER